MWIILAFLSFSAMALEAFERLPNVKILKSLPDNIVLLNRGLEDGLARNDHIKLVSETEGYGARGICLKATTDTSYWRLYRIPNSEAFSKDFTYTIVGLADQEIPFPTSTLRDSEYKIADDKPKKEEGPDPFLVQRDLPEKLTERDLIKAVGPDQKKLFIEQVLNKDQLERDFKNYRISVYASPFTRQSINDGQSLRYGFRGGNVASKYRLLTQFEQQQTKLRDPLTDESVSTRSTNGQAQFVIHQLSENKSTLSLINYQSTKFSRLGTPKAHWQTGPLGFTWHMHESTSWEYLDLSYVPLYDVRETDIINKNGATSTVKENGLRHGFRFAMKTRINERVAFENLLWVRPYQNLSTWRIEGDNLNLVNDLKLIFNLAGNLFFDYNFVYQKDKLWKTLNGLPDSNAINSLNLRYDFDL
jgi:hypothetical protein